MQRIIFGLFVIAFLFCFNVYSQDLNLGDFCGSRCIERSGKDFVSIYSYSEKKQFIFTITTETIEKTPLWNLGEGNPPISISDSVEIARNKLKSILIQSENWKQDKIELRTYQKSAFYIVWFKLKDSENDNFFKIVVLMNGEAVEPKIINSKN